MNSMKIVSAKKIKPEALKNKQMKAIAIILNREKLAKMGMYFNNVLNDLHKKRKIFLTSTSRSSLVTSLAKNIFFPLF